MEINTSSPNNWSFLEKIFFRFISFFFFLFIFPFPLSFLPWVNKIFDYYDNLWTALIAWTGQHIFGLKQSLTLSFTGSGDKMYDWVMYFIIICLAIIVMVIWSILDRKRTNYEKLKRWFVLLLTYYLAYFLFVYGIIKLFYLQFTEPNLERLFQTFGQASPMRLLWTFMGASESYVVFSGFAETMGGILLVFRRTRTLGALVAFGVMLNIFMLNMSFDVPVKLFSAQLMLMALYIACLDYRRLLNFFVFNKAVPGVEEPPLLQNRKGRIVLLGLQILLIGYIIFSQISGSLEGRKLYGFDREKSTLYGVYNVQSFIKNQDTLAPLLTDTYRWKRLLFDYPNFSSVILMNDRVKRFDTSIDTLKRKIYFSERGDTLHKYELVYEKSDTSLLLSGVLLEDTIQVDFKYYPRDSFGLIKRGFHWINEVPYNRYNVD